MTFEVTVDVIINVLNEIFQKKLPKTNPEFPETFLSQVPKINAEKLNLNTNLSANEIASLLFLDKNKKIDILSFLIEEQNISKQSPSNRKYSSLVHIQSFSVLFFEDLNHLTLDECQIFTKSLILAVKINPEVFELAFKAFSIFYSRLSDPQFFQFREIADYFLESLNKQWTPIFWNVLIHQSTRILKNIDINDIKNEENSSQNRSIQKHFLTIAKLMSIQNEIQLEFSSDDLFESIGNFFIDKIDDFEQSLIIFGIELSGKTNSNFPQLISFLEILINNIDLFQNISKLADENECNSSCECLKFENILEIKQFETNCFDSIFSVFTKVLSKNLLLKIVVETTKRQINEKKINFIVFLLTFLSKEFVSKSIVSDFLRSNNEMNLLLPSILFQQDYLVNHSNQIIYSLELLSLSLYSNFLNSNSYPIELENLFDLFKDCEDKYNELLLLSSQFLHEIKLSNKFFQTMKIHFYTILHNEKLIENYKNILSQLLKSNYFVLSAMNSDEACICFCECLRISGFEEICKSFLLKYFELETVNHDISIFSTLYKAIKETSCKNKVYELVLNVISTSKKSMIKKILNPTFINTLQNSLIEPLTQKENSSVINDSGNINSNHQEETNNNMEEIYSDTNENTNQLDDNKNLDSLNDIPNVEIIFKILEFSRLIPNYDISWDVINEAIYHNTSLLTDNVYESILKILSNDDSFTGIHNKTATPLIKSLINSKYAEPFLLSVISIIANNYVQLLSIFNYGVVQILLESAPTLSDPLFELIMSIVVNINNIISNREIVEMFLSVFNKIVEEERSLKFLIYFEKSLKVYEHSHANVIHFDTLTSEIKLPVLSIEYFTHCFSFSTKLLIPNFNDGLCLLTVKSTNHYLSVILEKNKVLILSNHYSSPVEINLEFPENKWFTFKMKFISLDNILVQLDENTTLEISLSNCIPWTSQIRRIYMLKNYNSTEKRRNVEGFISQILIFSDFENKDLKDNKELNKYNSKSENLLYHFSPRHIYNGNVLKNLASKNINYYSLSNAKVDADCVSYIPTFAKVFTSFLGLREFIIFFTKKPNDIDYCMNIFTTLKNLLKDSVELQKQMLEINGFHLIAHFLRNIDPKRINISVWNNIESFENICLLKELLKSFYDSIIINFKPWLDANDEVLFLVIKKWIQIDVKLFISCLTFPAFCHVIYHQFHDRKISNVTIKNNIVHLLLNVSKLFSEKEMSILCQLVGKMATDVTSALSMLQTVRVITTDNPNLHSIAVNVMVNDERLMHSRNPEILCGIIQLFAQNDLNYIAILLRRQIQFQRDYTEIDVFLSYLCAALVGKSSNTLEDLFYMDISKHTISPPLIPFVLAFSFQASTNQIEKVTNFLLQILSDKECLHFIANSIDSLTLFLLISYSIVLSNRLVKCLVDIITTNIMLFSDAYLIYDILAEDLGHDLHDYQNAISCSVLLKILENKQETSPVDISQIIDIVVNSMCYGVNRSVFDILKNVNTFEPKEKERRSSYIIPPQTSQILRESRERRSSFTQSPEMFIQLSYIIQKKFALNNMFEKLKNNCFKNQKVKYGLVYKKESTTFIWADTKTAELLMQFFDDPNLKPISSAQLCVILCFLCHSHFVSSSKKICYYLNLVAEKYDIGCSFITPLLVEVSSHIEDFTAAELFLAKFQSEIGLSSEFYESATQVMESFVNSLHPISNISCKLGKLFNFEFDPLNIMNIDSYFLDLQQKDLTRNTLREKMYRKLRPIYTDVHRRYNLIDNHFRPYLLINTERFNFELIDSPIVEEHLTNEIWSARCQRCKLDIKIDGFFIITENGIRFSTTKGKSIFILKSNVRCVFWNYYHHKPLSFTFITRKGKSFLFKFDEDIKREDVVANLKKVEMINCSFFQENEPSIEIGRLELTQRWRKREISNFDYILWLNMLSGRTFLDSESYPIFPFIFASYENQSNIRDFSRNISIYLSKENAKQLRERRMSDLDPYRSFLFSQAFSTSELIKKFLGSISQFHCETYFTSYKEIIERITEGKLQCELPPEFFFMPEIFEKWKEFPKYAPNASVFMMKNLKALETEEVSMTLHKWIDIIWGASQNLNCMYDPDLSSTVWDFYKLNNVSLNMPDTELNYKSNKFGNLGRSRNTNNKSNKKILNANSKDKDQCNNHFSVERITEIEQKLKEKGQLPKKLFAGPHPARGTCIIPHTENLSFKLENNSGVLAIGTNQENSKGRNAEIFFFHKNEKISICNLKQTNKIKSTKIPIDKSTSFEFINFFQSHLCFVPIGINKPLCYDITTKTLYANNSESPHLCGVSCMDSLSNFFVTGSYDSSIVSWSKNSNTKTILPLKTLLAHRKPIKQIKIQEEMRVLLSIDETGLLSISIFPFLKLIKSIQTGILNVDFIEMTRNSIICFKGSEAKNFTANGTENGRRNFGFDVVCECSIESRKRTDIVAISTSLNEIITINAISLQAISLLEHHWCLIIRMKYSQELDSLFCTTEDNEVLIIPISE